MGAKSYDFAGWATVNDIKCSDGVTIRHGAFADCDGKTVPLVWNHGHNSPENVVGRGLLKQMPEGMRLFGTFNNTDMGETAHSLVQHGDITALSIYANHVKKRGTDVVHGMIREVSLVLAGANEGAVIDEIVSHGDDGDSEFILWNDPDDNQITIDQEEIAHAFNFKKKKDEDEDDEEPDESDDEDEDDEDSEDSEEDEDEDVVDEKKKKIRHADDDGDSGETIKDVFDTLTDKQKTAVYAVIGAAVEGGDDDDSDEEDENVKHNVFSNDEREDVLVHADFGQIMADAKRLGSFRAAVLEQADSLGVDADELIHADTYGVRDIESLFPDAKSLNTPPEKIMREMDWVPKVLNGAHHSPFSRIKSQFANITEDEARARGYIKGKLKKEEVFSLLRRTTDPCTVYKKQKIDRDDMIDITDFDVVAWIRSEMRTMLDEELARAILIGDGRLASDEDHIPEDHIRPIWKDHDLFNVKCYIEMPSNATDDDRSKMFIRACIKSRKLYKGSGNPTMFTTEDQISDMLLLEDGIGHMLYESEQQLATKCRVSSIQAVPLMEGVTDPDHGALAAVIVNMKDYNVGADKGGSVSMMDDFDIDYNQYKYLLETRCSGALIKPYSAITILIKTNPSIDKATITFSGNGLDLGKN